MGFNQICIYLKCSSFPADNYAMSFLLPLVIIHIYIILINCYLKNKNIIFSENTEKNTYTASSEWFDDSDQIKI